MHNIWHTKWVASGEVTIDEQGQSKSFNDPTITVVNASWTNNGIKGNCQVAIREGSAINGERIELFFDADDSTDFAVQVENCIEQTFPTAVPQSIN